MSFKKETIGNVLELITNGINCKQNKEGNGVKITRIETIANKKINFLKTGFSKLSDIDKKKYKLIKGDILFSHINSPIHVGKTAIYNGEEDLYHGVNLLKLRVKNYINPNYFNYFLNELFQTGYWSRTSKQAVNQASVNQVDIKKIEFSYPSIQEQNRIVAKLDAAFAEIDKDLNATTNIQKNIKNINKQFLNNFENENKNSLCKNSIGVLCNLMTGGTPNTKNKSYYEDGKIHWLVSGDVNKGIINDCEGKITELGYKNSNAKYLPTNSVIIALNGQGKTRGTVALLKIKATCNQSIVSIYPKDEKKISTEFIFYYLKSKYEQIRKITGDSGNDRRGLNMSLIRKIKIKYPENYQEQIKLVNKINAITENVLKMEENYQSKINNLLKLKQSILKNSLIKKDSEAA